MDEDWGYRRTVVMALLPLVAPYTPTAAWFSFGRYLDPESFSGIITMALLLTHPVACREFTWEVAYEKEGTFLIRTRSGQPVTLGLDECDAKRLSEEAQAIFSTAQWR